MEEAAKEKPYRVRAVRCDHRASDEEVYAALRHVTHPLSQSWAQLERAQCVALKVNLVYWPDRIRRAAGRRQELVDDAVLRGVLRLLRERTRARLVVVDTSQLDGGYDVFFRPLLREFGAEYVESNHPPFEVYEVPGGGQMFARYRLSPVLRQADAVVSVAKLKNHAFMGVTLCTKNLFGLPPIHPSNRPRTYFHHIIRLPYVLADLARIVRPCLNIVDGLVGQSGREWGGTAQIADLLAAGDHVIATDACVASLMGHNPRADWPTPPFRRDANHLLVAAEGGFGTVNLDEVDFVHDLRPPVGAFDSDPTDPAEMVWEWRRSMCEQALHYRDHRDAYVSQHAGEYIYLQDGEVLWHGTQPRWGFSRRQMSGAKKASAIWVKYVDPEEWEGERYEAYERERAKMAALVSSAEKKEAT
ncbi:MAG: DUF362 domain-containing protein [Armatimonadota bacterium]|nr:DUF362 domain-containing protein [Armatimonadota bacterium]